MCACIHACVEWTQGLNAVHVLTHMLNVECVDARMCGTLHLHQGAIPVQTAPQTGRSSGAGKASNSLVLAGLLVNTSATR
jgi:hypothetical protein